MTKSQTYLIVMWLGLPALSGVLYLTGQRMHEAWREHPATEVEMTDCRIEAMMEGDNPVDVRAIERACLQAANDAYTRPRSIRLVLGYGLLVTLYVVGASFLTWLRLGAGPRPPHRSAAPEGSP
jgi:hypothetical protein